MADEDKARGLSPYDFKRLLAGIEQANEQNAAVTGGNDILTTALSPSNAPTLFRVMVAMSVVGVLRVTITKGGDTQILDFNAGANIVADSLYMFDHLVHSGDTINYQYSVNATLRVLRVQEIPVGAQ